MKKQLLSILFCIAAMMTLGTKSKAQAILIDYWSFNAFDTAGEATGAKGGNQYNLNTGPNAIVAADFSVETALFVYQEVPGTSAAYAGLYDTYFPLSTSNGPDGSDTINAQLGAGAGSSFRARNPNDSSEILLYMSTKNISSGLVLTYACEKSSEASGDSINVFSYSTDSGAHWVTSGTGLSEWIDSGSTIFRKITVNITDPLAYNNTKFVFRITFAGPVASIGATGGNDRFDNITLMGVPNSALAISSVNSVASVYNVFPNPANGVLNVTSNTNGTKSATVYNVVGQKVYEGTMNQGSLSINTSTFASGVYYISLVDVLTSEVTTKKFIKQ